MAMGTEETNLRVPKVILCFSGKLLGPQPVPLFLSSSSTDSLIDNWPGIIQGVQSDGQRE